MSERPAAALDNIGALVIRNVLRLVLRTQPRSGKSGHYRFPFVFDGTDGCVYRQRVDTVSSPAAAVTSRIHFAWVVASEETHSTSLLPGPRSSELAIALSAFS